MRRSNRFAMSQQLHGAWVTSRPAYEVSVGSASWPVAANGDLVTFALPGQWRSGYMNGDPATHRCLLGGRPRVAKRSSTPDFVQAYASEFDQPARAPNREARA